MTDDNKTVATSPMLRPDDLRVISSFDDAVKLAQEAFGTIADATDEIGDGFVMLEDKTRLVNEPFIALGWVFAKGDFGSDYMVMRVVTEGGRKFVVTDGSTGLCQQIKEYRDRTGKSGGMMVARGLRKSEYDYTDEKGVTSKASTYYLNV